MLNKRAIRLIVALMSLALLGITVIQFFWIKWSVDLNAKNFDDKVTLALNQVHNKLIAEAEDKKTIYENFSKDNKGLLQSPKDPLELGNNSFRQKRLKYEYSILPEIINPQVLLNDIKPETIDRFVKSELDKRNIDTKYDYGVFSFETNSFTVINGNYVIPFSDNETQATNYLNNRSLYNTQYEIKLFESEQTEAPGSLKLYFPHKRSYLWSTVWGSLLASILFTGLILFCFIYTINVILFQKKVSEMKTDFINNMTHEFKTPIATISLASDSILSEKILAAPEKVSRFAHIIKEENKRMLGQVEKVLQIAQVDKRDFQLKIVEVDMHEIINRAIENLGLKVKQREGQIVKDLKATNPKINADKTHVTNMVHNLLDNAEKYSSETPHITIETSNRNGQFVMAITDQGIGMTKESQKSIFEKFYRVHTGNLHDVKGFGLGLSYVKEIVHSHKGKISVKSELGKGSTFEVVLPTKS